MEKITFFPDGVIHSPRFTTPKDPLPNLLNRKRFFVSMRQVWHSSVQGLTSAGGNFFDAFFSATFGNSCNMKCNKYKTDKKHSSMCRRLNLLL